MQHLLFCDPIKLKAIRYSLAECEESLHPNLPFGVSHQMLEASAIAGTMNRELKVLQRFADK
ncbi:hypothetical protein [Siminovitchia sp. 179-K 8D1 HS]|uniref:hypothetical protein n=1 Tax=Siminovitchia sp. 179-K 8D1 HS TaxID=3142385 RepID=UPI0039A0F1DA